MSALPAKIEYSPTAFLYSDTKEVEYKGTLK